MARKAKYGKSDQEVTGTYIKRLEIKNNAQADYINMLKQQIITLCIGPAGTGKTYLASYVALEALIKREVDKIVLTRPIVACEEIGFLPGDMNEKIHPYLMPLFDAIESHIGPTHAKQLFADGKIEILPLAYMRGRSLNRAFIILDEAQNTKRDQMKMFLTRLGYDSRIAITGDSTQSDLPLPKGERNGLTYAVDKLVGADASISVMEFKSNHIVRHPLISKIIDLLDAPDVKYNQFEVTRARGLDAIRAAA